MNGFALQKHAETEGTGVNPPGAPQAHNDRFLKLNEVQQMFGVSRSTVWRWHAERGLKVVTIGAVTRIRESDLQAFLKRHESNTQPDAEAHGTVCEAFTSAP